MRLIFFYHISFNRTTGLAYSPTCHPPSPRTQVWSEHFQWSQDGIRIEGKTAVGRATISALHLSDDPDVLEVRRYWVMVGWHPPQQ